MFRWLVSIPTWQYALAAGVLLAVSFLHPWVWPLGILGVVLLLHVTLKTKRLSTLFGYGLMIGFIKSLGATAILWSIYPVTWFTFLSPAQQLIFISLQWLVIALVIGLSLPFFLVGWRLLYEKTSRLWLIAFPIVLVLIEIAGSFLFSLYVLGLGGTVNISLSFGYLGYLLADVPGVQLAALFGGVYTLTILVGLIALTVYLSLSRFAVVQSPILILASVFMIGLITVSAATAAFLLQTPTLDQKIITVNTYFDQNFLVSDEAERVKREVVQTSVNRALAYEPDVIVLPEDSKFGTNFDNQESAILSYIWQQQNSAVRLYDSASIELDSGHRVIRASIYDTFRNEVYTLDKQYLVPLGEYIPNIYRSLVVGLFDQTTLDQYMGRLGHVPGPRVHDATMPSYIPRPLFCMESVSPTGVARSMGDANPAFIVHPVSHAWFHNQSILRFNLERMLTVQSIQNQIPIVQAGNMSHSMLYLPDGQRLAGEQREAGERFDLVEFAL